MAGVSRAPRRRLAEVVAERLEREIVGGSWEVGDVIGSETQLIERMDVSRAVFREAARIVEHHGVARMRRGPGGGLIVTQASPEAVRRAAEVFLHSAGVNTRQLFETRMALELACAAQAADRITPEGVARLREVLAFEESFERDSIARHSHDIHVTIAELTGNPAMVLFVTVLDEMARDRSRSTPRERIAGYHRAHRSLAEAIIAGNPALARERMRQHLVAVERSILNVS